MVVTVARLPAAPPPSRHSQKGSLLLALSPLMAPPRVELSAMSDRGQGTSLWHGKCTLCQQSPVEHERDVRLLLVFENRGSRFWPPLRHPQSIVQSRGTRSAGVPRRLGRAVAPWSGRGGGHCVLRMCLRAKSEMQKGSSIIGGERFLASGVPGHLRRRCDEGKDKRDTGTGSRRGSDSRG